MTPDDIKLQMPIWQRKCAEKQLTLNDMKAIVNHLREGRTSSLAIGKIKREAAGKRKPKEKEDAGAVLLAGFEFSLSPDKGLNEL